MGRFLVRAWLLFVASLVAISLSAQQCPLPPSPFQHESNIFSPEQEMHLGDAVAQHLEREFSVIKDEELNRHLRQIGERLLRALPPGELRYQFFLFDLPVANAWGLPGGRIYLSRKMVAFARSEDELAGILAHEIGHIYTHQQAIDFSRWFKEALRVTEVGNREDIFKRYHQLLETRMKSGHSGGRHDREQHVADQLALYAMARAGYNVRAVIEIWDRQAETKGKTGGFWSDLFGTTSPESKRLREMLKSTAAMPASCVEQQPVASQAAFAKWQSDVIAYTPSAAKEQLQGVLLKRALEPPLQGELSHLRFSPDGKYLLAQDDGGITVLSREPLASLFHIEAEDA
ncbi:MAG: M48 family metalloprotease, partial [Acidobacteriales bacterium]|nr:M48 family metalloprotease [Terriglobales bacterium]